MNNSNEFSNQLIELEQCLNATMLEWNDQTSKTFGVINENTEKLTNKISENFLSAKNAYDLLKKNYNEEDFGSVVQSLASSIEQV